MSRPKGSKNKKTLEKELQAQDNKLKKNEWKPSVSPETKDSKATEQKQDKAKQASTLYIEEKTDFVQYPNQTNKNAESEQNYLKKIDKKQLDKYPICERCHERVISVRTINLTYLTSQAPWHRNIKEEKIHLCNNCSKQLNSIIEEFLIDGGKGVEIKW